MLGSVHLHDGKSRFKTYISQVKASAGFKVLAVLASFICVPVNIHYLGVELYGVWSTVLTVLSWFTFFDLGLGNGLRNKIAEALAKDQPDAARGYISSAYSIMFVISAFAIMVTMVAGWTCDWHHVFNTTAASMTELRSTIAIAGIAISVNLTASLIMSVLNGVQMTSLTILGQFSTNILFLLCVVFLNITAHRSLTFLALSYGLALLLSNAALNLWFYRSWHRRTQCRLWPLPRISKSHVKPMMGLGVQFFTIQIAVMVLFTTDKIIITQLFGPSSVTPYDVLFKYFSVLTILFNLVSAPLWPAYADAYHRQDMPWIRSMLSKQMRVFYVIALAAASMALLARPVIHLWVGGKVAVTSGLIFAMMVYVIISAFNNTFGSVLGGMNKIRLGSIYTIITAIVNVPLCYFFASVLKFGVSGIVAGTITSMSISAIVSPIQVYYFTGERKHSDFWDKALR